MKHQALLVLSLAALLAASCSDDTRSTPPTSDTIPRDTSVDVDAPSTSDADATADADADVGPPPDLTLNTADEAFEAVDPFIGTGGVAFGFSALTPAAQRPLGLVKLGPDTTRGGRHPPHEHFGGYNIADPDVRGFSHLHFVGTGVADYGNLRVSPLGDLDAAPPAFFSPKVAESESAEPGYYRVELTSPDVLVELTATLRVGIHRYTFQQDGRAYLAIDPTSSVTDSGVVDASVQINNREVTGWVEYRGGYVGRGNAFTLHFSALLDRAPDESWVWTDAAHAQGETSAQGPSVGAVVAFDDVNGVPLLMKVGVSMIDLDHARANRIAEADEHDFDALRAQAREDWLGKLGRVQIAGGTEDQRDQFFTALYNIYRMPSRFDDTDGQFRSLDAQVYTASDFAYYSDLSLWDSFRTTHPMYALIDPEVQRDCLRSLLAMYAAGGAIPRWPAALSYTGGMIGTSADFLFAESALKGVSGVDYDAAFDALMVTALADPIGTGFGGRGDMEAYLTYGYLPADLVDESVSRTLEYAYADGALARLAAHLGRDAEAASFDARAHSYEALFDAETRFFRPRNADGTFADFEPLAFHSRTGAYTEGTPWQWRFYVPHDPEGLIALFGDAETLGGSLQTFFTASGLGRGTGPVPTGLFDLYYWHGNQPPLHTVYLFMSVGRPDRFAYWMDQILTRIYHNSEDGLPGNDDGGTLSAWYLFSALGVFPLAGTERYVVGAPVFPRAVIHLESGASITLDAPTASATRRQVESLTIDGAPLDGWSFTHDRIADGATLHFEMREIDAEDAP